MNIIAPCSAYSRTTRVLPTKAAGPTIQMAIDAASSGDSIVVEPGQYTETIDFKGKELVLISAGGAGVTTLVAPSTTSPVVRFRNGEGRSAVLSGFRITGGRPGVHVVNAQPTIVNNVIDHNSAGIQCVSNYESYSPLIKDNKILSNISIESGGGIAVRNHMFPQIIGNEISGNEGEDGGGVWISGADDGCVIRSNKISNNIARDHGGGIYVALSTSQKPTLVLEISWNLIVGNVADRHSLIDYAGGGIWLANASAWVHHNTIASNTGFALGNAIAIVRSGHSTIEQNIMAFNVNGDGVWCVDGARPSTRNNIVWPGFGGAGGGACDGWWLTGSNLMEDPQFCDLVAGDYSLADISGGLTHPAGPLGAIPIAGCSRTSVTSSTWGAIKSLRWR